MNYQDLAKANRRQILRLILRTGGIPRSDLARQSGLAKSTVSDITDRLLDRGVIENREIRKSGRRGRPVTLLSINARRCKVIVADYSDKAVRAHIVDPRGRVTASKSILLRSAFAVDEYLAAHVAAVEAVGHRRWAHVQGITVVGPGVVDAKNGVLLHCGFRDWKGVQIAEPFRRFGKPVFVQNGSRLRAVAENWYGAAQDIDDFLYFHLDRGIGGAIVMDGALLEGPSHGAGEFGHMLISPGAIGAPPCCCGGRGCLESVASMPAVARGLGPRRRSSFLQAWGLYKKEEAAAVRAFDVAADAIARGVINAVIAIGPTTVLLGGRMVDETEGEIVSLIRRRISERQYLAENLDIRRCLLPDDRAAVLGAAAYALGELDIEQE